jgi:hypothetical protein
MVDAPYPIVPVAQERDWRDRHPSARMWVGGLGLLAAVLMFTAGVFCLVEYSFHHHPTTQEAVARAQSDPRIVHALGRAVQVGWFIKGNIHIKNGRGYADLRIPLSGPKGKGTIVLYAREILGKWEFSVLRVDLDDATTIDLM